ncbi:unnamed protein product, partial [Didymodactylos carnosus]
MNNLVFYQTDIKPTTVISTPLHHPVPSSFNYQPQTDPSVFNVHDFKTTVPPSLLIASQKRKIFDSDGESPSRLSLSDSSVMSTDSFSTQSQRSSIDSILKQSLTTTTTTDEDDGNIDEQEAVIIHKRKLHTKVEAQRRQLEKSRFLELHSILCEPTNSGARYHHLDLLQIAGEKINDLNMRNIDNPIRDSNLTAKEAKYLSIEANNSFIFVQLKEMNNQFDNILYVSESVRRVLNMTPDQFINEKLYNIIHPDDIERIKSELNPLKFNFTPGIKCHLKCKMQISPKKAEYITVTIDGITKYVKESSLFSSTDSSSSSVFVFVGIVHLPLVFKLAEKNRLENIETLRFRC